MKAEGQKAAKLRCTRHFSEYRPWLRKAIINTKLGKKALAKARAFYVLRSFVGARR